jgi:hypothetical protein
VIPRIYRELKKLNSPRMNEPIKKWATELNRTFSKEKMLTICSHKGNANQNYTKIPPHPLELPSSKTPTTTCVGEDVGKKHTLLVGMQAGVTTLEKNLETS